MSVFKLFSKAAVGFAGVKMIQTGSDSLIQKHSRLNVFALDSGLRAHADELLKQRFLNGIDSELNEYEAALLKLTVFFKSAEISSHEQLQVLSAEAIRSLREAAGNKIRGSVSLEVMGETGL